MQAPLGYRLWRWNREDAAKGDGNVISFVHLNLFLMYSLIIVTERLTILFQGTIMDPFKKHYYTSCNGVPLGGIG